MVSDGVPVPVLVSRPPPPPPSRVDRPLTRPACCRQHVGCDWTIDSAAKEDRCGVCHGDGATCHLIKDSFTERDGLGYVEAMVIPKGARNIRVEEVAAANNYLAVRNEQGHYYLNGHWFIQWSGDYMAAGTTIHYKRDDNREQFTADGPLTETLYIMVSARAAARRGSVYSSGKQLYGAVSTRAGNSCTGQCLHERAAARRGSVHASGEQLYGAVYTRTGSSYTA